MLVLTLKRPRDSIVMEKRHIDLRLLGYFIHPSFSLYIPLQDFDVLKQLLLDRGHRFVANALKSRVKIAELGHNFVHDGMVNG